MSFILLPSQPRVVLEEDTKGVYEIDGLYPGYGHTLGNSLRRIILSSLSGAAIVSVKIEGVSHEFSVIDGIKEDAISIILNLKKVRVKLFSEKSARMVIKKTGVGEVKASDIDTQGLGEIVNPEAHIATITDPKASLNIEMTVEIGSGYVPAEEKDNSEIGNLSIDAIFSPVLSVNYTVDQTRVGRNTNFDKLNLEVTTDGTITPTEAVNKAAEILSNYFRQVVNPSEEEREVVVSGTETLADAALRSSVEELDLPVRITNALKAIEIDTIGKLVTVPRTQLMKAKNLGTKSLGLISEKLAERGLSLGEA